MNKPANKNKKPSDDAVVKRKSRRSLKEEYGPRLAFNMHEDDKDKLLEIAQWLDGNDYSDLERGKGKIYREAVSHLINIFYIDTICSPRTKAAKKLAELYREHYKLHGRDNMTRMERKAQLSKSFPTPDALAKGELTVNTAQWKIRHLDQLSNYRWVANTLTQLDKAKKK
ncbi:hypothetical protein [Pectobacterium sp. A5351]|uniref:hypothetical protein n=1 Tax=Pectobacterium sp. A5351 TaxID=2914983 RepID=UPI00232D1448|nr:hypothetical protein [Pectobacterium sp. A5351]WCG82257.1 hypothetical protein O1Q74_15200 [Pectobacterium sp. A5351]